MVTISLNNARRWVALLVVPAAALAVLTTTAVEAGHRSTPAHTRVVADLEWDVAPAGH